MASTQHYCCDMIPELVDIKGPYQVLPIGIHDASMEEIEARYATNLRRKNLFLGFKKASEHLFKQGCQAIYLNGSYVTDKAQPGDYDAAWDANEVDLTTVDDVLKFADKKSREQMKRKYGGEFFPFSVPVWEAQILKTFQTDKHTGEKKGILRITNPMTTEESQS